MVGEDSQESQGQDKILQFLSLYKFPLIFALAGLIFITGAAVLIIRQNTQSANVVFITQATESAKLKIKVDLAGSIIHPGVYELEEGSRISDALTAAGGLSADADRDWIGKNLNRAAKLADGGKVYIPSLNELSSDQTQNSNVKTQSNYNRVNLNTASQTELESISGIGPVLASKIITGRPYQTIDELKSKKIIGNALFEKIKDQITL